MNYLNGNGFKRAEEEQSIEDLLSQFNSVPLLREIEDRTIQLKRQYKTKLPDAIIAATALF